MSEERHYRDCLGRFATGVTVMTCRPANGDAAGITVNSFASVSLEPRLILWSIARDSRSTGAFLDANGFVVNILARDQEHLSSHFAQTERPGFAAIDCATSNDGHPVLADCLAWLYCGRATALDGGDHYILVAEVEQFHEGRDASPLLYFAGAYRSLAD